MKRWTTPSICICSCFTDSMVVNSLVGTEIVGGEDVDFEHMLQKESWLSGAVVENC